MRFPITRKAREIHQFDPSLFTPDGKLNVGELKQVRAIVQQYNLTPATTVVPERQIRPSQLYGMGLLDQIFHRVNSLYKSEINPNAFKNLVTSSEDKVGLENFRNLLITFIQSYPPEDVFQNRNTSSNFLDEIMTDQVRQENVLEDLVLLWISTQNPALRAFAPLIWDQNLVNYSQFTQVMDHIESTFAEMPHFGPENQSLIKMLKSPAENVPESISGQLEYIRSKWGFLLGDLLRDLLKGLDLVKEEEKAQFLGPGVAAAPNYDIEQWLSRKGQIGEIEAFSQDREWMPRLVLIAKNIFVWLDQLTQKYQRPIKTIDQIPDDELMELANRGITGLWLIGLWQRSPASAQIKQLCGNPEAVSSAYSLYSYRIADILGGDEACERFKSRAANFGIRLASDMVPNHMGIDSEWVIQHPEWFLSVDDCPFPAYTFSGLNLSQDENIVIQIEDHYYDRTDAAVVFKRLDLRNGQVKYIYHGNDGTSMPWNDTAQLNYLDPHVREEVIRTIIEVAKRFPIIRFDAAMTLAKKHIQRLWYPEPGEGGAIPSRSWFSLSTPEFDHAIPKEFWREVVERIESEAPDTLLLAEAFWMMEGYFVRTLGMHRVYNSAFMHMLRDENNAGYHTLIKNTLDFDPEILKRFVNFMNNPDERTAIEQFGNGDKYFGVCTLMISMPGLPMFGHGQIEGFTEKYGMEYSRAMYNESADSSLVERHRFEIFPLLKLRELFAGVDHFRLFDFWQDDGQNNENVYAYSNQHNSQRVLVFYNNNYQSTHGRITHSYSPSQSGKTHSAKTSQSITDVLGLRTSHHGYLRFRDISTGLEFLRPVNELFDSGFVIHLNGYEHHVFVDFKNVQSSQEHDYDGLYANIGHIGVHNLDIALNNLRLQPIIQPVSEIIHLDVLDPLNNSKRTKNNSDMKVLRQVLDGKVYQYLKGISDLSGGKSDFYSLKDEIVDALITILQIPFLGEKFSAPGTEQIQKKIKSLVDGTQNSPTRWFTLIAWALLGKIGNLASDHKPIISTMAWLEDWELDQPLMEKLRIVGVSEQDVQMFRSILRVSILYQDWVEQYRNISIEELLESLFTSLDIRRFLKVNYFEDILWYDRDAFEELLWWLQVIPLIKEKTRSFSNLTSLAESFLQVDEIIKKIRNRHTKSQCQVDKLLMKR